jgi:hypothetical protein
MNERKKKRPPWRFRWSARLSRQRSGDPLQIARFLQGDPGALIATSGFDFP